MLDKLITFAITQRIFLLVLAVAVAIAGWRALSNLSIEAFPDVQDVQVLIITQAPGLAPEEVERSISLPIEREMGGVPRQTQLRSVSITGLSVVTLTFADRTDDYFARQQVLERLQTVDLPTGIKPSIGPLTNAVGEIYRYVLEAPADMPVTEVRALQDWVVKPALRRTQGVADIVSFGGAVKEYQAKIEGPLLRKYNVTIDQVSQALTNNSANGGGGLLRRGDEVMVLRSIGLFRSVNDIAGVVVSAKDGKTVLVGDLGKVEIGQRPLSGSVAFNDRDSIVEGIVQMTKGQNAAKVIAALKEEIERVGARLPKGVKIVPYYDRTELVSHTVHTVGENLLVGAGLVVAILIVFLRNWHAALAVTTVIPLSMLFAFILIDAAGVSANLISLGSVDFGIIIDSAVVLVEALMVKLALGQADGMASHAKLGWRLQTLKSTALELGRPILFAKVIIIIAFLPIFTFQRVEGKIFSPMAYTLSFALLGALILTLTLVPALLSYSLQYADLAEKHSKWMHALQERYRALLLRVQGYRQPIVAGSVVMLAVAVILAPLLGSEFLPKLDEGNIWLTITMPPATALETTQQIERAVRKKLRTYPEVKNVISQLGRPDDGTDPKGPNNLEILADLNPKETWRFATKEDLIIDMTQAIREMPGIPTNFSQVIQDNLEEAISGARGEIVVKIFGTDLDILEDKSEQVAQVLRRIRGATDVAAFKVGGQSEVNIKLDRGKMARFGINVADVNSTVQTALAGNAVNSFFEGDRLFDVTVRLAEPYRDQVGDLPELPVGLPGGSGTVPLDAIATLETRQGATRITREAGQRTVAVKANLINRDQGSFVKEAMGKVAAGVKLPSGYVMTWGGQFENQQRALKRLQVIIPLAALLIFILLFWAFNSLKKALLVLMMVPFTFIGGLAGLGLAGLHLSVSAAVGFIAVAGIAVQNGVIMVQEFIDLMDHRGFPVGQAVLEGATIRLRPIIMTALMAGLGLLPAALSHGIGSETQRPFAVVIVGGVVSATLFTLLLLPLLFSLFTRDERVEVAPPEEEPIPPASHLRGS